MNFECREVEKHILIIQQRAVFKLEASAVFKLEASILTARAFEYIL